MALGSRPQAQTQAERISAAVYLLYEGFNNISANILPLLQMTSSIPYFSITDLILPVWNGKSNFYAYIPSVIINVSMVLKRGMQVSE